MCILLKLHYAKFDVSSLFCSKVIEEKPSGGRLGPGKGRVKKPYPPLSVLRNEVENIKNRFFNTPPNLHLSPS